MRERLLVEFRFNV